MPPDAPAAAEDRSVNVEVLIPGLVVDHVARKRGDVVAVTAAEARTLGDKVKPWPLPLLRCDALPCMIGNRALAVGETAYAPTMSIALDWHRSGRATILNAPELGITLPPRAGERRLRPGEDEPVKLRARYPLHLAGIEPPYKAVGDVFECGRSRAEKIVQAGQAEPVGWTPRPPRRVLVQATKDQAHIGRHMSATAGQIVAVSEDEAEAAWSKGDGTLLAGTSRLVRIRSTKADCYVGDRTLDLGQVAEVPASIAEDLITEGAAELTTDPLTLLDSPRPKKARTA